MISPENEIKGGEVDGDDEGGENVMFESVVLLSLLIIADDVMLMEEQFARSWM